MTVNEATTLCLDRITGQFETGGRWDRVTDNFDGFGPSIGILQFAFGTGSLQPILRDVAVRLDLNDHFNRGDLRELFEVMRWDVSRQRLHANENWFDGRRWKRPELRDGFQSLAKTPEFKAAQVKGAGKYERKALKLFEGYIPGNTLREYAIFFDLAVQNGGVRLSTIREIELLNAQTVQTLGRDMTDVERLRNWIRVRARKSNPRWQEDVLNRKLCILNGKGRVHGKDYDFADLDLDRVLTI